MLKENPNEDQLWKRCPQGMLRDVADRSAERSRAQDSDAPNQFDRRRLLQLAAGIAITAGAGTIAYRSLYPLNAGSITCNTFLTNLKKFTQEGLDDQQLIAQMDQHRKECKSCKRHYDRAVNA